LCGREKGKTARNVELDSMDTRTCYRCQETKPLNLFVKDKRREKGYGYRCKKCHNKVARHPDNRQPIDHLRQTLADKQDNRCAICGVDEKTCRRRLAIDHCHTTNVIRGLLCDKCNHGVGLFQDNPVLLRKASEYLLQANPNQELLASGR
jgi:hypothetical protein